MSVLVDALNEMPLDDPESELVVARDACRAWLQQRYPASYAAGTKGVDIVTLSKHFMGVTTTSTASRPICTQCLLEQQVEEELTSGGEGYISGTFSSASSVDAIVTERINGDAVCTDCQSPTMLDPVVPDVLCVEFLGKSKPEISPRIRPPGAGSYRLAGVIYYGGFHFVSRVITLDNKIYAHDGMIGSSSVYEGVLDIDMPAKDLVSCWGRAASLAVYVSAERKSSRPDGR